MRYCFHYELAASFLQERNHESIFVCDGKDPIDMEYVKNQPFCQIIFIQNIAAFLYVFFQHSLFSFPLRKVEIALSPHPSYVTV